MRRAFGLLLAVVCAAGLSGCTTDGENADRAVDGGNHKAPPLPQSELSPAGQAVPPINRSGGTHSGGGMSW